MLKTSLKAALVVALLGAPAAGWSAPPPTPPVPSPAKVVPTTPPKTKPATKAAPPKTKTVVTKPAVKTETPAKPKTKPKTKPKKAEEPLPDGVFQATLRARKTVFTLEVTIIAGFVTYAELTLEGGRTIRLTASGPPDAANINLIGRDDVDSVRVRAMFDDAEIATGTFSGTLSRRSVSGSVELVKR